MYAHDWTTSTHSPHRICAAHRHTATHTHRLKPSSIQMQSLALSALCKRKPQETQALALASSQSWLPLLRPSIPIGWRLRLLREILTEVHLKGRRLNQCVYVYVCLVYVLRICIQKYFTVSQSHTIPHLHSASQWYIRVSAVTIFTGQNMTEPTVSKHWRTIVGQSTW